MKNYAIVDENKKIIKLFGWGDNRKLHSDYPKPDGSTVLGVPENFAENIRQKWVTVNVFVENLNALMDSTKDYAEYFTETEIEQTEPIDPIAEMQTQNAQIILSLVQGGLM